MGQNDVGTGTGILAIAAAKLNLKSEISNLRYDVSNFKSQTSNAKCLACDTDVDSITIAKENAAANGVGNAWAFVGPQATHRVPEIGEGRLDGILPAESPDLLAHPGGTSKPSSSARRLS